MDQRNSRDGSVVKAFAMYARVLEFRSKGGREEGLLPVIPESKRWRQRIPRVS